MERAAEYRTLVLMCFVDLTKVYDTVDCSALVAVLKLYGVPHQLVDIIQAIYTGTCQGCQVRTVDGTSGVRQDCVLSLLLFNCLMDRILREMTETLGEGFHTEYATGGGLFLSYQDKISTSSCVQDALYADDLMLIAETRKKLQHMIHTLDQACERWGMHINGITTKILTVGVTNNQPPLKLKDWQLEEVESFPYCESEVGQTTNVEREVMVRLKKAGTMYQMWRWKVFQSCNLSKTTKLCILCTLVMPILLYGAETWPVTEEDIRKLRTFYMRRLQDILGVTLWGMRRNADILRETGELPIEG